MISSIYTKGYLSKKAIPVRIKRNKGARTQKLLPRSFASKQEFADHMRKNPTVLERVLYGCLERTIKRRYPIQSQKIICGYIADYFIPGLNLVVEADGPLHKQQQEYDARRDKVMRARGYHVIRFNSRTLERRHKHVEKLIMEAVELLERRIQPNSGYDHI